MQNKTTAFRRPATNGNMVRVFEEGTAFFITTSEPENLMAQRGSEIHYLCQLEDDEITRNVI